MEEIELTSKGKQFEVFIPKECDLDICNKVVIRGREFLPVVHGEWIPMQIHGGYYYMGCSVCSHPMPTDSKFDFMDEEDNKFCYNCGAKMDGKEKEDG